MPTVASPISAEGLQTAIIDYHRDEVRSATHPAYLRPTNANNILGINKDTLLARVLDLNGLHEIYLWAHGEKKPEFALYPRGAGKVADPGLPNLFERWLDAQMDPPLGVDTRARFLEAVLAALAEYQTTHHYQPAWATLWNDLKPWVGHDPRVWLSLLGMPRSEPNHWLVILVYPAREAGGVCRPTQIDVGWECHHFPSPPSALPQLGGHPMNLGTSVPAPLLTEYIHDQIPHRLQHWEASGSKCERTSLPTDDDLSNQRKLHHDLLVACYGPSISTWFPPPPC